MYAIKTNSSSYHQCEVAYIKYGEGDSTYNLAIATLYLQGT